jgi:NADH-quinone oxidoreductase subunit A
MVLSPYFPILIALTLAFLVVAGATAASLLLGPTKPNAAKYEIYECGLQVKQSRNRLSVKFYLTAILFLLFDIETIFLYLWGVAFNSLGWFGVAEVALFVAILVVGYAYILKRGALNWE